MSSGMKGLLDHYDIRGTTMGWYTPESWERLRAVADDVVMTFAEFEQKAERKVRQLEAEGFAVEKVMIDVDHMVAWCRRKGYRVNDSKARAAYGTAVQMARDTGRDVLEAPVDDGGLLRRGGGSRR
jgi:hypothetical protein